MEPDQETLARRLKAEIELLDGPPEDVSTADLLDAMACAGVHLSDGPEPAMRAYQKMMRQATP